MERDSTINLVQNIEGEPRVSHRIIAEQTGTKQKNIVELLTKHIDKMELFGQLPFQTESVQNSVGAINQLKTFYLNEQQATLLLTFMRNNETVINFKVRLVQEFFKMRQTIKNLTSERVNLQNIRERA
jgi:phage regulator Rha-like protein